MAYNFCYGGTVIRTVFCVTVLCVPLSGMETVPTQRESVPALRALVAQSIYQEFSAADAEQRYSVQETFDLITQLKKHAVWDLVANSISRDSSGEEMYWTVDNTELVPRSIARLAPRTLYHDSATGAMKYQCGSTLRSLEGVQVKNPASNPLSWILSDDGACAVGYGSYAGSEGLLYAELITGGVYPLELPHNECFVHAFIPQTQTLQLVGKSGLYEAPLVLLFQQGKTAWRTRMKSQGISVESITPLSYAHTILVAPHEIKSLNLQDGHQLARVRPPEGSSIERAVVSPKTGAISYITRQMLRANRSKVAHLWMMDDRGARWNTEVDAAFPVSMAFSPDGRLVAVVAAQGSLAFYTSMHGELFTTIEGLNAQQVLWNAYYFGVCGFGKGSKLVPTFAHYAAYSAHERAQKKECLQSQKLLSGRRSRRLMKDYNENV